MLKFGFPASHYFAIVNIMFKLVIQTINLILFAFILLLGFSLFFASFFVCEGKGCNFSKYIRPKSYPTGQALESQMHFYPVYRSSQRLVLFNAQSHILRKISPVIIQVQCILSMTLNNGQTESNFACLFLDTFRVRLDHPIQRCRNIPLAFLSMLLPGCSLTIVLGPRGGQGLQTFLTSKPVQS